MNQWWKNIPEKDKETWKKWNEKKRKGRIRNKKIRKTAYGK